MPFVIVIVLYGYMNLIPHAFPSTPITFREYTSDTERQSYEGSYVSLVHSSSTSGFYLKRSIIK